jgi:hypothetical protein
MEPVEHAIVLYVLSLSLRLTDIIIKSNATKLEARHYYVYIHTQIVE